MQASFHQCKRVLVGWLILGNILLSSKNLIGNSYKYPLCPNLTLLASVALAPERLGRKPLRRDFVGARFPADPDVSSFLNKIWALWMPRLKQLGFWCLAFLLA